MYLVLAIPVVALRMVLGGICQRRKNLKDPTVDDNPRLRANPANLIAFTLTVGAIFLPRQPWKHMTSTLLYDIVSGISSVLVDKSMRNFHGNQCGEGTNPTDAQQSPFGTLSYNPATDPYYITNLNQEIDPFIAEALDGAKFTNVVQIILESVRGDSYPFQEDGLLHRFIKKNIQPAVNATPITTENITPFIQSLAENTIVWDDVWSMCVLTHKAMMGCTSLSSIFLTFSSLWSNSVTTRFRRRSRRQRTILSNLPGTNIPAYQLRYRQRIRNAFRDQ